MAVGLEPSGAEKKEIYFSYCIKIDASYTKNPEKK
jgi:hypothetical protein